MRNTTTDNNHRYQTRGFQSTEQEIPSTSIRRRLIKFGFIVFLLILIVRLFTLHITQNDFLRKQGNARTLRTIKIPSYRGLITDRRGVPLAVSTPVDAIWMNPKLFNPSDEQLQKLSSLLNLEAREILSKQTQYATKSFVYLKRGLPPNIASQVADLRITGLGKNREFKRFYPSGKQVAQLVGFTDIDDVGQAGLELSFENHLKPKIGKKRVLEDRMGNWIQDIDQFEAPKSGQNIALSIDLRIQSIALRELEAAVEKFGAKSATLVMIDIESGEVLAMVTAPSYNPNNPKERVGDAVRNKALTDQLEPGSTVKPISVLSALASEQFDPNTIIDTYPGTMRVGDHVVRDLRNYGKLSIKEILERSSNVGVSKITLSLPSKQLINTFDKLGLGTGTLTSFPGEQGGKLPPPPHPKNPFGHATLAFGYGLAVTPIQLAQAYAVIGAKGIKRPVSLIKQEGKPQEERVLPQNICESMLEMLVSVGHRAKVSGFLTAGKTGTVRVVGPQGYDPNRHIGLFAGVSPVKNPKLATVVIVEEPDEKHYYGGLTAAPIYKNVVSQALIVLNVPPEFEQAPIMAKNETVPATPVENKVVATTTNKSLLKNRRNEGAGNRA